MGFFEGLIELFGGTVESFTSSPDERAKNDIIILQQRINDFFACHPDTLKLEKLSDYLDGRDNSWFGEAEISFTVAHASPEQIDRIAKTFVKTKTAPSGEVIFTFTEQSSLVDAGRVFPEIAGIYQEIFNRLNAILPVLEDIKQAAKATEEIKTPSPSGVISLDAGSDDAKLRAGNAKDRGATGG